MVGRRAKRWLLWLGTPLLAVALLVVSWSWDWFIPLVEARASAAVGRPVHIEHLRVKLGHVSTVTAEGLRIGNPSGFPDDPPFAEVRRATVQVDVGAFLRSREIVIPSVELDRPVVHVIGRDDGSRNYEFDFAAPVGEGAEASKAPGPRLGALRINDGKARVAIAWLRSDFEVDVKTQDRDGQDPALVAEARGTYAGQSIEAQMTGGAILNLRDGREPWPIDLRLRNGDTTFALQGTVREPLKLRGADLRVEFAGKDMADLIPLTGVPFPKTPPFRLEGKADYAEGRVRLFDAEGKVGRSDIGGSLSVSTAGSRPDVTADLRSRSVDLADLGGLIGTQPGRANTPGQTPHQRAAQARAEANPKLLPNTPVNMPRLTAANVHLRYRAERIQGQGMPFDSLSAETDIVDGVVSLHPVSFGIGQGRLTANGTLTPQEGGGLRAKIEVELRRADLSRLLGTTGAGGAGTLGGVARLEGSGKSLSEILGRGNGEATVVTVGGNISSLLVDLSGLQFGNALLSALGIPARESIECLIGDFALQRGTLRHRTLLLDTDAHVVTGAGTLDLGREQLDLRLRTDPKQPTVASLPTPIRIGGTLKNPAIQPELGEAAARAGAAVGLGLLFPPLALLPTIQLGVGENGQCERLQAAGERRRQPAQAPEGARLR
ncbi:AsmA family protein [Belnapia sp. T18]|uniref:AsmA family protein n=1 Tax=Belnapia arida TaxID=2804533 RepID=A0ABS1UBQ1_9PROT|nr:AsmA family protein [Belnapia arida]MBL6081112.1 AsmA family protein [Belnapia arida]